MTQPGETDGFSVSDHLLAIEKYTKLKRIDYVVVNSGDIEVAKELYKKSENAVKDHEPVVRFQEFGDSNINFTVWLRAVNPEVQWALTV